MENKYYEIIVPNINMVQIYGIIIGDEADQTTSVDETKMIVKLPLGDTANHGILNSATELTHEEAVIKVHGVEYSEM